MLLILFQMKAVDIQFFHRVYFIYREHRLAHTDGFSDSLDVYKRQGMSLLGDSLKKVAGSRLEVFLGKLTSTHIRGILLGTFVTAVIQSSSATTVMVVGFVNSGVMKLSLSLIHI